MKKIVCFDARKIDLNDPLISLVLTLNYTSLLINEEQIKERNIPNRISLFIYMDHFREINVENNFVVISGEKVVLNKAKEYGNKVGLYCVISDASTLNCVCNEAEEYDYILLQFNDETNIPLELVMAKMQNKPPLVLKYVETMSEAAVALHVMEKGSDGIILSSIQIDEVTKVSSYIERDQHNRLQLVLAEVINVKHIEMGYRACIDTTSILGKDEGLIIGSTSSGGILVSSETHYLPYMETRPFRVNAGAVHSYLFNGSEETFYLTELRSGFSINVVDVEGNTRIVSIGRVKIEQRPLLKIEAKIGKDEINTIVQDDWHIRIFGENRTVLNASSVKCGDKVLAYVCSSGRHVGIKIDENIIEL